MIKILSNGINVVCNILPNVHSVALGLYIKSGSMFETVENNGINHLIEHLHFRRLNNMSQKDLYYATESIGSTLRGATYRDFIRFHMKIRPAYLKESLKILASIPLPFEWTTEEFHLEKQIVLNQILERDNYLDFDQLSREATWNHSPLTFPIMGNIDVVESLSMSDVIEYKKKIMTPSNLGVYVTGCLSEDDIACVCNTFEQINLCNEGHTNIPLSHKRQDKVSIIEYNDDLVNVNITFEIDYNKYSPEIITILNCILGEGIGSRLQMTVRERYAYSSDIYSYIEEYKEFGFMHINYTVAKEHLVASVEEITKILYDVKTNINENDLNISLPFYTENLWYLLDDTEELNFKSALETFVLGREEFKIVHKIDKYKSVSIEDLKKVAERIFTYDNISMVMLGDLDKKTEVDIDSIFKQIL